MPVIRLTLVKPIIAALHRLRIDSAEILKGAGLPTPQPIPDDLFVSANSVYRFVNLAATVADDPYFGARVGYGLDLADLPQISAASKSALIIADFLIRIAMRLEQHSTSVRIDLQIQTSFSTFNVVRLFKPDVVPSHLDAYYIGVLVKVLKAAIPSRWSPKQVRAKVSDPHAIPPDLEGFTVAQGDGTTVSLTFPSKWLFEWVDTSVRVQASGFTQEMPAAPATLIDAVKNALRPHIHETDLTVERSAEICGVEKRRLSRQLKANGTTLAKLIAGVRQEQAAKELTVTNRKIAEIAQSVGFRDPTVFSRAFKNWTGQSPQEYRRNHA